MAVVSCKKIAAGRSADGKSDYNRSYQVVWKLVVNDRLDGPATVGSHHELPARFAPYVGFENTDDPYALCTGLKPEQDGDDWQLWKAVATFETQFTQAQHQHERPEEQPPVRWIEIEFERKKVTREWDGTPIRNSAGQLIDGLERDDAVATYCFERNELAVSSRIKSHNNSTNSDNFYDLLPYEGLLRITCGKPQYRNGTEYWPHVYRVKVNPDKWKIRPADKGTLVKGSDGKLRRPVSPEGEPMDGEVYLDGSGNQIAAEADIVFLPEKKLYKPQPWSALQLGG